MSNFNTFIHSTLPTTILRKRVLNTLRSPCFTWRPKTCESTKHLRGSGAHKRAWPGQCAPASKMLGSGKGSGKGDAWEWKIHQHRAGERVIYAPERESHYAPESIARTTRCHTSRVPMREGDGREMCCRLRRAHPHRAQGLRTRNDTPRKDTPRKEGERERVESRGEWVFRKGYGIK